ncbi:UDP-2,3-diacylglucosamine diphosphatase [Rhodoferax sp. GW822-FHT02A01]|uniref:UDP-2,3-diacylglucosamine diphosphatase n=1 Tax=Rhodoferax sp. GW822-FHT02A01 TaxID=3141537 RepID=UPI00315D2112
MDLLAPSHWRCVDFISDLHLQDADRNTFEAWAGYMRSTDADAVFILGDLFEVWVGDDALQPGSFEAECVHVLRAAGDRLALYIMQGNRDFLMGPPLMQACQATALPDPSVLVFGGERWLLSHGDALCTEDHEYLAFRSQVRSSEWQRDFLAKPLSERQGIARAIRNASENRKQSQPAYADVNIQAALRLLQDAHSKHLIHGHTHQPAQHQLGAQCLRTVLSDWDVNAKPVRAEVLRLTIDGPRANLARLPLASIARTAD